MVGTMTTYDFNKQLSKGEDGEQRLDEYFSVKFDIQQVSRDGQRRGIDRVFQCRETGKTETIEYKTDLKARYTHNAFIETVSVDTNKTRGWAFTTKADKVFYYVPGDELVYVLEPATVRELLDNWQKRYPVRAAQNKNYKTFGVCVPLSELEICAIEVISL